MSRHFIGLLIVTTLLVPLVLLSDGPGIVRQGALGLSLFLLLAIFARQSPVPSRQIILAVIIATIGEVVLSIGWGLYTYRHFLIALYVPAGHGLLYALAAETSHQPALRKRAAWITNAVLLLGTGVACFTFFAYNDVWGVVLWIVAAALVLRSHDRLMLSASVVYTMLMEWTGTALGNWQWTETVPFLRLTSANPPAGVGIFYVILDLLVVLIAASVARGPVASPALTAER